MPILDGQFKAHRPAIDLFDSLAQYAINHTRRILLIAALITVGASLGMKSLRLRTDGLALVSDSAPEVVNDRAIRDHFGVEDPMVVVIHSDHPDGIFNPVTVQLIRELTSELVSIPGVNPVQVVSLATEPSFRFRPGTYLNQLLLDPALSNQSELNQLRDDLRRIKLYTGTLASSDGKSTVILIGVPDGTDRSQLYRAIQNIVRSRSGGMDKIGITGAPVAEALLGTQIFEDLGVPAALFGVSMQGQTAWKLPSNLHECCLFAARRIGLIPMAVFVMMAVFFLCFRNCLSALLPLPGVAAMMLLVFGLMGWCDVPLYLTTAVMPVLLTVLSVTNDIYLFNCYFRLLRENPSANHIDLIRETFHKLARPVACTSLTAVIGFFSFGLSPLVPVQAFGIFTAVGALFGLLFSLSVLPALLVLVNPARLRPRHMQQIEQPGWLGAWFARARPLVLHHRWWVVACVMAVISVTPFGLRRLTVQDSWTNGFDPDSEFRRITKQVNNDFFGIHELLVSFETSRVLTGEVGATNPTDGLIMLPESVVSDPTLVVGSPIQFSVLDIPPGVSSNPQTRSVWRTRIRTAFRRNDGIFVSIQDSELLLRLWDEMQNGRPIRFEVIEQSQLNPKIIQIIADLSSFISEKRQYAVGGVLSPADYLLTTRFMLRYTDPQARRIPDSSAEVKLLWKDYESVLGPQHLHQIVDKNYNNSLTTVFLKDANFVDTARLMGAIRAYARTNLEPQGIRIGFAGDVAVSQALIHGIVVTQLQSLIWSLLGIFVVTAWFGGSWRWGLYCMLPSLFAVIIKFALMGWAEIPLGVATSMFAAMTLGIGVNCAIHLLEGYRQAQVAGAVPAEALNRALALTGPPAFVNTLAMSLGFGVLMLSQVPANARLGVLMVLGLVNCFIASLLILPALLQCWPLKTSGGAADVSSPHRP
jgi:uncharacterized protein